MKSKKHSVIRSLEVYFIFCLSSSCNLQILLSVQNVNSPVDINCSHFMGLDGAHTPLGAEDFTGALHLRLDALPDINSTCWQLAIRA